MPPQRATLSPLEKVVLLTVAYTDQFEYPLTAEEVLQRCVSGGVKRFLSALDVERLLSQLTKKKLLESSTEKVSKKTFFYIKNRAKIVLKRLQREKWASERGGDLERVQVFCQKIPWIDAVFVTGSLAMNAVDPESDIDFMMIVQPKRLWLTRVVVSLFAQLHGKRRSWNHEEPASWCFNLWLDSDHLEVEKTYQDLYRAYEVLQAKLLWQRKDVGDLFFVKNTWIDQFFIKDTKESRGAQKKSETRHSTFNKLLDSCDWLAWKLQTWYMKRHQTNEKVGRGFAFFHPRDTKGILYRGWKNSLERCLPKRAVAEILESYVKHSTS